MMCILLQLLDLVCYSTLIVPGIHKLLRDSWNRTVKYVLAAGCVARACDVLCIFSRVCVCNVCSLSITIVMLSNKEILTVKNIIRKLF